MSDGALLLWFGLTGLSFVFVAIDIRNTPAHPVIQWAFVILALFTGPFAAFFYVLGCREPLRGAHEAYVAARWRQVLGSTMHCAAGDGLGILAGAAISAHWHLQAWVDFSLEYFLGFSFGWAVFQAYAMRDMMDGDYLRSLRETFYPEFLSMNLLMAGMVMTMHGLMPRIPDSENPSAGAFWFVMSMALVVGFIFAYPVNWWLVARGLKHGMITVRPATETAALPQSLATEDRTHSREHPAHPPPPAQPSAAAAEKIVMTIVSVGLLALGVATAQWLGD